MEKVNVNISTNKIQFPSHVSEEKKTSVVLENLGDKKNTTNDTDYLIDISQSGKNRAYNNYYKKAGVSSAREAWEDSSRQIKAFSRITGPNADIAEAMRYEEPETYQKWIDLRCKYMDTLTHDNNGLITYTMTYSEADVPEEGKQYLNEASKIMSAYSKRYNASHATKHIENTISQLESKYSDAVHDVTFNMYGGNNPVAESMWRYNSKFSVMISKGMLDTLMGTNVDERNKLLSFLDDSVNKLKLAEVSYEGDLEWLRFGLRLNDDWSVSYHANFNTCKETDGIQAASIDELLQKLASYTRR